MYWEKETHNMYRVWYHAHISRHPLGVGVSWKTSSVRRQRITVLQFFIRFFFLCVWLFHLPACLCTTCMQGSERPEEGVKSPRTWATKGCEQPCGRWEANLSPLKEQSMLLTAKPSLKALHFNFKMSQEQNWWAGPSSVRPASPWSFPFIWVPSTVTLVLHSLRPRLLVHGLQSSLALASS